MRTPRVDARNDLVCRDPSTRGLGSRFLPGRTGSLRVVIPGCPSRPTEFLICACPRVRTGPVTGVQNGRVACLDLWIRRLPSVVGWSLIFLARSSWGLVAGCRRADRRGCDRQEVGDVKDPQYLPLEGTDAGAALVVKQVQ